MKKILFLIVASVLLVGCKTTYLTSDGEKLIGNSVVGCLAGAFFLYDCKAGAVGGAAVTLYQNETK